VFQSATQTPAVSKVFALRYTIWRCRSTSPDGTRTSTSRAYYERSDAAVFVFDARDLIRATADGYRWQDRAGNFIDYDAHGRIQAYGDRNALTVRFRYEGEHVSGVLDPFGNQVLWYEWSGSELRAVRVGRSATPRFPGAWIHEVWSGSKGQDAELPRGGDRSAAERGLPAEGGISSVAQGAGVQATGAGTLKTSQCGFTTSSSMPQVCVSV
jgi:hypothetical protein